MKRALVLAIALLVGAVVAAGGATAATRDDAVRARANQHEINGSKITGRLRFVETAAGVQVTGKAKGLAPLATGRYVTLVYDLGSTDTGPTPCEPTVPMAGMFVGFWTVKQNGHGRLVQTAHDVAPLALVGTVSIRDTTINGGFGPEAVVACGKVVVKEND